MTTFELKVLKRNNYFMFTFLILLLGGIGTNIMVDYNQGKDISTNKEAITGILDSGAEFISRKVTSVEIEKAEKRIDRKLDAKADKSAFEEFGKKQEEQREMLKTLIDHMINN